MNMEDWGFATMKQGFGVWIGEGCDEIAPPLAIFRDKSHADDFCERLEAEMRADDHDEATHIMDLRNVEIPFWNNGMSDPPADEVPPSTWHEADHIDTMRRLEKERDQLQTALEELLELDHTKPIPKTYLVGVRLILKGGA